MALHARRTSLGSWASSWTAGALFLALSSCSSGDSGPATDGTGAAGHPTGSSGSTGMGGSAGEGGANGTGGAGASTGGASGSGGSGQGGSSGASGMGGGGNSGTDGGSTGGAGGAAGGGGSLGEGGTSGGGGGNGGGANDGGTPCATRALSLSANQTGTAADTARARVVIDLTTDLPIGNATRTVEFWAYIKTTDWVGEKNEIYMYGTAGTATAFGLDFGTNPVTGMAGNHATLNPYTNGGFNDDSKNYLGITSTTDQWVHIAMTWDGTALRTYVNGVVGITTMGTGGVTMLATAQSPLTIGCNDPIFNCFNGDFAEFRLWKAARTATQIKDNYNKPLVGNETDLVGYWKFNDAPGSTTAADSVTGGRTPHPGTLTAISTAQRPTFITPTPAPPILCP